jgi:exopolyphosphatase
MKVNAFVANTRLIFNELLKPQIVLGNQSADLDSIVSAISMSFYLNNLNKEDFIPVINSSKEILKSKQECMYLFDYFSINLDDLVFLSECKSKQISEVEFFNG